VIHRDLKPANVMLRRRNDFKKLLAEMGPPSVRNPG
jgi:hypothetical protein